MARGAVAEISVDASLHSSSPGFHTCRLPPALVLDSRSLELRTNSQPVRPRRNA